MSDRGKIVAHARRRAEPTTRASSSSTTISTTTKVRQNSYDMQKTTRTRRDVYKDPSSGTTHKLSQTQKTGEFIDRRSGRSGQFIEERYKSSFKVSTGGGSTKTFEFEVRVKEKVDSHKSCNKGKGKEVITYDSHYRKVKY